MKCFYHQDRDAVGMCKSCQKGLCPDCAVDLSQGLACKERCEEDVRSLIRLIQNNIKLSPTSSSIIRASRRGGLIASTFYIVLGVMFAGWGLHDDMSLIIAMGVCFVIFGVISVVRVLRIIAPQVQP
jgi:hypothetical protein